MTKWFFGLCSFMLLTSAAFSSESYPPQYDKIGCRQKCGLSPYTKEFVDYRSVDENTCLGRLAVMCEWRGFRLQGQPEVSKTHVSLIEEHVTQCIQGGGWCRVCVACLGFVDGKIKYIGKCERGRSFEDALDGSARWCSQVEGIIYVDVTSYEP